MKAEQNIERGVAGETGTGAGVRIIVCDELGCGVVPMDAFERAWRERTGRIGCELAKQAEAVYRVTCGIGTRIK